MEEQKLSRRNAVSRACFEVGGQSALARLMKQAGVSIRPQAIQQWCAKGYVPAQNGHAKLVSQITGVALSELNPAVY